jgi:hypothetical protein
MQLVGQTCIHCRARITRESDGRFCPKCNRAVHLACSQRALTASSSGSCRACGAPAEEKDPRAHAKGEQPGAVGVAKGYWTVLAGVALMIGGILGSMCFAGWAGNGQLVVAGAAISGGVVLVVVGFLQERR